MRIVRAITRWCQNRCAGPSSLSACVRASLLPMTTERLDELIAAAASVLGQSKAFLAKAKAKNAEAPSNFLIPHVGCRFCNIGQNDRYAWNQVLLETNHFVVVPSKGGFVPGWTMILPKHHVLSMAQLHPSISEELDSLLLRVCAKVQSVFGPATVFEHGATCINTTFGCGIDHAHLHVVPLPSHINLREIAEDALDQKFGTHQATPTRPYLRVRVPRDLTWYTLEPDNPPPRQFFRQLIWSSHSWEANSHDYDEAPCEEQVHATIVDMVGEW